MIMISFNVLSIFQIEYLPTGWGPQDSKVALYVAEFYGLW